MLCILEPKSLQRQMQVMAYLCGNPTPIANKVEDRLAENKRLGEPYSEDEIRHSHDELFRRFTNAINVVEGIASIRKLFADRWGFPMTEEASRFYYNPPIREFDDLFQRKLNAVLLAIPAPLKQYIEEILHDCAEDDNELSNLMKFMLIVGSTVPFTPEPPTKTFWGIVYLMRNSAGHYKIGRTANMMSRYQSLCEEHHEKLQLVHWFRSRDMFAGESRLHAVHEAKRLDGEWFTLTEEDVAAIRAMTDEYEEPTIAEKVNAARRRRVPEKPCKGPSSTG